MVSIFMVILISSFPLYSLSADEIELGDAEINAYIKQSGWLPSIKVSNWTSINVTIDDTFSMNWSLFQIKFFNENQPFFNYLNRLVWNFLFRKLPVPVQTRVYCKVQSPLHFSMKPTKISHLLFPFLQVLLSASSVSIPSLYPDNHLVHKCQNLPNVYHQTRLALY